MTLDTYIVALTCILAVSAILAVLARGTSWKYAFSLGTQVTQISIPVFLQTQLPVQTFGIFAMTVTAIGILAFNSWYAWATDDELIRGVVFPKLVEWSDRLKHKVAAYQEKQAAKKVENMD